MEKILVLFLCVSTSVVCGSRESNFSVSSSNGSKIPKDIWTTIRELEQFHEEFQEFKASLVKFTAEFVCFHRSSTKNETGEEGRAENPDSSSFQITSCSDAIDIFPSPQSLSKRQRIYPHGNEFRSLDVLCDFETDGGGWTVIQKRSSGPKEEFNRNWTDYTNGFGSLDGNFWIGLENIHALTKNEDQELRIELEDFQGEKKFAYYSNFSISDASDFYRLAISGFSTDSDSDSNSTATAGDSITDPTFLSAGLLNGMRFTTNGQDNDQWDGGNCAEHFKGGGWWYNDCSYSYLNGLYQEKEDTGYGIRWYSWKGCCLPLAKTEMKIRTRKSQVESP